MLYLLQTSICLTDIPLLQKQNTCLVKFRFCLRGLLYLVDLGLIHITPSQFFVCVWPLVVHKDNLLQEVPGLFVILTHLVSKGKVVSGVPIFRHEGKGLLVFFNGLHKTPTLAKGGTHPVQHLRRFKGGGLGRKSVVV